jgi:hypothetical protein
MLVVLGGCVRTEVDTFRKVPSTADEAFVKRGVNFTRYRRLQPYPLEIYYYKGQGEPNPADLERIRGIFREAFLAAIGDDYELVDKPGSDVLGVRASLVDLKLSSAQGELPVKGRAAALVANGQLTFFMEVTDSRSGEVLGRAADRERPADESLAVTGSQLQWVQTEAAARRWAAMFRDFLDRRLGS